MRLILMSQNSCCRIPVPPNLLRLFAFMLGLAFFWRRWLASPPGWSAGSKFRRKDLLLIRAPIFRCCFLRSIHSLA